MDGRLLRAARFLPTDIAGTLAAVPVNMPAAFRPLFILLFLSLICARAEDAAPDATPVRTLLIQAINAGFMEQEAMILKLADTGDTSLIPLMEDWKDGKYYHYWPDDADDPVVVLPIAKEEASPDSEPRTLRIIETGELMMDASGKPITALLEDMDLIYASRVARRQIQKAIHYIGLNAADPEVRIEAADSLGLRQDAEYLEALSKRLEREDNDAVIEALNEAIAMTQLSHGDKAEKLAAIEMLGELKSQAAVGKLQAIKRELDKTPSSDWKAADIKVLDKAIRSIENHIQLVIYWETAFQGISLGAVLVVVALGLAITFGLMGVINMAHGEMIAIGAYATYITQEILVSVAGEVTWVREWYFLLAIPFSFFLAALAGLGLERGVIRFLYKRPLESLLATWGVSWVLQQVFRLVFGAANRQVNSPSWLVGTLEVGDVGLGYNRIFVIFFAAVIIIGTWLLMSKTPLGLSIRAVMQNPQMAASMGISTARVRMITFAFGSGLAGLAGAFLSQIGSVGASLGQTYIIDSFMVVVAGGVGNLLGTILSAFGIGLTDQILQPSLGPVMGRITVLVAIILFLQWKPGGLFPAKTRSLD